MKPTSEQLAANVIPVVRDYVNACIEEAVAPILRAIALEKASVEDLRLHLEAQRERTNERLLALDRAVAQANRARPALSGADIIDQLRASGMLNEAAVASLDPTKKVT